MKYFVRDHRGTLKESLETTEEITKDEFLSLLNRYSFYAYDCRCNQLLWVLDDMEKYFRENKTWLGIELD